MSLGYCKHLEKHFFLQSQLTNTKTFPKFIGGFMDLKSLLLPVFKNTLIKIIREYQKKKPQNPELQGLLSALLATGLILPRRRCLSCGQTPAESSGCLRADARCHQQQYPHRTQGDASSMAGEWPEPSFSFLHITHQSHSCAPVSSLSPVLWGAGTKHSAGTGKHHGQTTSVKLVSGKKSENGLQQEMKHFMMAFTLLLPPLLSINFMSILDFTLVL